MIEIDGKNYLNCFEIKKEIYKMYNYENKIKSIMIWDEVTKTVHTGLHYLTQGPFSAEEDRYLYRLAVEYNTTGFLKVVKNPRNLKYLYIDINKEEFVEEINKNLEEI